MTTSATNNLLKFRVLAAALCTLLLTALVPVTGLGENGSPQDNYRVLDWKDLVRDGWEPPLLLSEEEVISPGIDESSLVPELDRKLVALPGFMRPVVREGDMLAPVESLPANLKASMGGHWEYTQRNRKKLEEMNKK